MFKKYQSTIFWLAIAAIILLGIGRCAVRATYEKPDLIINEFVAANVSGLTDEDGDTSDWLELYNPGSTAINLSGWALTDDPDQPEKWRLPDITLNGGQYLVVFASGKNRISTETGKSLHTNFKLRQSGEFLALYNILDEQWVMPQFPRQFNNIAFGRYGDGLTYGYLPAATPGQPNGDTPLWAGLVAPVNFSLERGFYNAPVTLELTTDTPGAIIRYTTDGSEPNETRGLVYREPITIQTTTPVRAVALKPGFHPSAVETHSYIFINDVLRQPPHPAGFPATWGIHHETIKGFVAGTPVEADYEMDPAIVNNPRARDSLLEGLTAIPSLSIVTARANLDIYANPREEGRAWERPASIELIDPAQPGQGFQINAGLRIHGDLGRQEYMHKHSFRLFFRDEYGADRLEYPLFPDSPVKSFDTLILRAGVQDSYLGLQGQRRRQATYTRDEWLRQSQIEISRVGAHGRFVHLYLNGLYWGLYNIIERPDHAFGAAYFNSNKQDWYAFNHGGNINVSDEQVKQLLQGFIYGSTPQEKYEALAPIIDTTAFADYVILNWYAGAGEWPENNWYAGFRHPDGKIRYFVWDGELTWDGDGAEITFGQSNPPGHIWPNTVELFFQTLIQNPDFRVEFTDRLYKHLYHDGALTNANAQARFKRINQAIETAITGEFARWGDNKEEPSLGRADWQKAVDYVLAQMRGNADRLIKLAREKGYYSPVDPPAFNQHGGLITPGFELMMTLRPQDEGIIYYTLNGADPRRPGSGEVNPDARIYTSPIPLTGPTQVKARLFSDSEQLWSALNEAAFRVEGHAAKLRIMEVMYNPPGQDDAEFIELKNTGAGPVDLSGVSLTGVQFIFSANAKPLAPGGLAVLVRNAQVFAEKYPGVAIAGTYQEQLSNAGEKISLQDAQGREIFAVAYDDENSWPLSADGRGDSLVLVNPNADPNNPKNWRAGNRVGGSPGEDEP
jgi:hypothetical protein